MTFVQAILISIVYYFANSPWPSGGLGNYATLYRPMVSGLIVGIILGDPVQGTICTLDAKRQDGNFPGVVGWGHYCSKSRQSVHKRRAATSQAALLHALHVQNVLF